MDERESELSVKTSNSPDVLAVVEFHPRRVSLRRPVVMRYLAYVVLFVMLGAAMAYVVANLGETTYGARSEIYHQIDAQLATGFLRQDRKLSTQLVKIQSREVLLPVARAHGLTVEQLSDKLEASVLDDSEILRIEIDDPSATRAKVLVRAITAQYLETARSASNGNAQNYLQDQIAALDQQRDQLLEQANALEVARQARATPFNPSPAATPAQLLVQTQLQSLLDQRNALESRLDDITIDEIRQPQIQELTKPYLLDSPVSPKPWRAAGAGALVGLFFAGVVVALLVRAPAGAPCLMSSRDLVAVDEPTTLHAVDTSAPPSGHETATTIGVAGWILVSRVTGFARASRSSVRRSARRSSPTSSRRRTWSRTSPTT